MSAHDFELGAGFGFALAAMVFYIGVIAYENWKQRVLAGLTSLAFFIALFLLGAYAAPKPKQGICHVCKCDQKAEKCISECGSKKICTIACSHDCKMRAAGIVQCPLPNNKRT